MQELCGYVRRARAENVSMVVYPSRTIDPIRDASFWGIEVAPILRNQDKGLVEECGVDPSLLPVGAVIWDRSRYAIRLRYWSAKAIQTLCDSADRLHWPPLRVRGGVAEHVKEDGLDEHAEFCEGGA